MGAIVRFDYTAWSAAYPMFSATVTQAQAEGLLWTLATRLCRNDGGGVVTDESLQQQLLWLLVAHIGQLMYGTNSAPATGLVGRVASATEGSVSVSTDFPTSPGAEWFSQTPFGALYWQLILPYRLGRYRPKITPLPQPINLLRGIRYIDP